MGRYGIRHSRLHKLKVKRFEKTTNPVTREDFLRGRYNDVFIVDPRPTGLTMGSIEERQALIRYLDVEFPKYRDQAFPRNEGGRVHLLLSIDRVNVKDEDNDLNLIEDKAKEYHLSKVEKVECFEMVGEDVLLVDPKDQKAKKKIKDEKPDKFKSYWYFRWRGCPKEDEG